MKINLLVLLLFIGLCSSISLQNSKKEDSKKCKAITDTNTCKLFQFTSNDLQCCQYVIKMKRTDGKQGDTKECYSLTKPIDITKDYYNTKQGQAIFKEGIGYGLKQYFDQISELEINFDCNDGVFNKKFFISDYNSDEISILNSDEHCLQYHNTDGYATEDKCLNSKIMKHSVNVGLTCGYYEYHVNFNDGRSSTYRVCNIFDRNIYNTKKFDNYSKEDIEEFLYSSLGLDYESFNVHITGVKNKTLIYYSFNNSIVYDGPGENIVPVYPESSSFLSKKNLLFLCFLFLF